MIQIWKGPSFIEMRHVSDKQNVQTNIRRVCFSILNVADKIIQFVPVVILHFQFNLSADNKTYRCGGTLNNLNHQYNNNGLCESSSKAVDSVCFQLIPVCSTWNYTLHLNKLSIK